MTTEYLEPVKFTHSHPKRTMHADFFLNGVLGFMSVDVDPLTGHHLCSQGGEKGRKGPRSQRQNCQKETCAIHQTFSLKIFLNFKSKSLSSVMIKCLGYNINSFL